MIDPAQDSARPPVPPDVGEQKTDEPKTLSRHRTAEQLVAYVIAAMVYATFGVLSVYLACLTWGTKTGWALGAFLAFVALGIIGGRPVVRAASHAAARWRALRQEAVRARAAQEGERAATLARVLGDPRNQKIRILKMAAQFTGLQSTSPEGFERLVLAYYEVLGFSTQATPKTADGGIDGHIERDGLRGVIQCKRHISPIGEPDVRDLLGVVAKHKVDYGVLVCSSHFTTSARRFAEGTRVELIDGARFVALVRDLEFTDPATGKPFDLDMKVVYQLCEAAAQREDAGWGKIARTEGGDRRDKWLHWITIGVVGALALLALFLKFVVDLPGPGGRRRRRPRL